MYVYIDLHTTTITTVAYLSNKVGVRAPSF